MVTILRSTITIIIITTIITARNGMVIVNEAQS